MTLDPLVLRRSPDGIRLGIAGCRACPLRDGAVAPVPFGGPPQSKVMLVGNSPDRDEDRSGIPFSGRAGLLLSQTLLTYGIDRGRLVLTHALKCHPITPKPPGKAIYSTCLAQHLLHEILLYRPAVVVTFGADTFANLVDASIGFAKARQKFWKLAALDTLVVPMVQPSYVLRDQTKLSLWRSDWSWLVSTSQWIQAYLGLVARSENNP
jgi:uracil-DNA glycosylase family 4